MADSDDSDLDGDKSVDGDYNSDYTPGKCSVESSEDCSRSASTQAQGLQALAADHQPSSPLASAGLRRQRGTASSPAPGTLGLPLSANKTAPKAPRTSGTSSPAIRGLSFGAGGEASREAHEADRCGSSIDSSLAGTHGMRSGGIRGRSPGECGINVSVSRRRSRSTAGRGRVSAARGRCQERTTRPSAGRDDHSDSISSKASSASQEGDSSGDDRPLINRRPAVDLDRHALNFTAPPPNGATVEIKWDPTQWKEVNGWFKATVIETSNGKLAAPPSFGRRGRRRIVEAGFTIVEYEDNSRVVHLLDEVHHVSSWGDKVDAWRLVSSPAASADQVERASGAANGEAASAAAPAAVSLAERGPDGCTSGGISCSTPGGARPAVAAPGAPEVSKDPAVTQTLLDLSSGARPAANPQKPDGRIAVKKNTPKNTNVWSKSYCLGVYNNLAPGDFRLGSARYTTGNYSVTRQMPAQGVFPAEANITIFVTAETSTVCYIAYTEETGPVVFMVKQIRKPVGSDWSNTLRGYQMYTTEQALARVDAEDDTKHLGCATSLGAKSLRHELAVDKNRGQTTYHPTDWEVSMDVRCIVGVVRLAQDTQRDSYDRAMHSTWPKKTSLIFTGVAYSESHSEQGALLSLSRQR